MENASHSLLAELALRTHDKKVAQGLTVGGDKWTLKTKTLWSAT